MTIQKARLNGKYFLNPVPTSVGDFSIMLKVIPRYLFESKARRSPNKPIGPFRTDAASYQEQSATGLRVTWFGHSSSLVEIDGVRVLIDPIWDERASAAAMVWPETIFSADDCLARPATD